MFSAPKDNSAEIARQQEERRQSRIRQGTKDVDEVFSQFDDDYFTGIEESYYDFYEPDIQKQFDKANERLILSLGGKGTLNSSVGAEKIGDLREALETRKAEFANQAIQEAANARSRVERERSDILSQLRASADPSAAAASANARAAALSAPPSYSTIGNLFADFVDKAALGLGAEAAGFRGFNTGLFDRGATGKSGGGKGSLTVVV